MSTKRKRRVTRSGTECLEPIMQDRDNTTSLHDIATDPTQTLLSFLPEASDTLSKTKHSDLIGSFTPLFVSESQEQLLLHEFVQRSPPDHIIAEFTRHIQTGKQLSWFQQVVPELRPGVEGDTEWLEAARELLWNDDLRAQHKERHEKMTKLNQSISQLPPENYELRQSWSFIVKLLQPISHQMAVALDGVSHLLGRSDCLLLDPDGEWFQAPYGCIRSEQTHVVVLQALQDKILSPVIDDLTQSLKDIDNKVTNDSEYCPGVTSDEDDGKFSGQQSESERTLQHMYKLRVALQSVRGIIVVEKDECDRGIAKRAGLSSGWNFQKIRMFPWHDVKNLGHNNDLKLLEQRRWYYDETET
ncbi:hypothetical protein COCVIDRAFT_17199 [Bipolaris victoriae FI3]|uniref:Uncharacterized protein n=1 Tax=Bipolaris victoriae (strain FI3) TaxID=930091 RepID=W7EIK4_BIPV3|nr:hypothetical protein COCVIDRAFT_17199 [Bipolaris victoriae FI3]